MGPRAKLHPAQLLVEWKVLDINLAAGLINGWRVPQHLSRIMQNCFGHDGHLVVAIGTELEKNQMSVSHKYPFI